MPRPPPEYPDGIDGDGVVRSYDAGLDEGAEKRYGAFG